MIKTDQNQRQLKKIQRQAQAVLEIGESILQKSEVLFLEKAEQEAIKAALKDLKDQLATATDSQVIKQAIAKLDTIITKIGEDSLKTLKANLPKI